LDGLRAIAILAVLIFHIQASWLRGGFTGVDVFFVLSGFLITSIILRELGEGTFSLKEFYLRRIQRLLPNILATLLGVLFLWGVWFPPSSVVKASEHGLWTLVNGSNLYIWKNLGGYWGDTAAAAPLLHTWSLAVEEQFYMFFPGAMLILFSRQRRQLLWWLVGLTIMSLGLCVWGTRPHPELSFYMMPFRVWELLMGAALAVYRSSQKEGRAPAWQSRPVLEIIGWSGLAIILYGLLKIREGVAFPGVIALIPAMGTLLVLAGIADGRTTLARVLSNRVFVWIGKLSFSLYLWHWPLIVFGRIQADLLGVSSLLGSIIGGAAALPVSWLAYLWVEQPLRSRGRGRSRRLAIIGIGFAVVLSLNGYLATLDTTPDLQRHFQTPAFFGLLYSVGKTEVAAHAAQATRYRDVHMPQPPQQVDEPWKQGGLIHAYAGGMPTLVVLGSSHALMYGKVIDDLCRQRGISVAFLCADATPPFFLGTVNEAFPTQEAGRAFDAARKEWIRLWHPKAIVVIDRWDRYADDLGSFETMLGGFVDEISPMTERIFILSQVPVLRTGSLFNPREFVNWRFRHDGTWPRMLPDRNEQARQRILTITDRVALGRPKVRHLRMDPPFYELDGSVRWKQGSAFLYADADHLSQAGAELAAPILGFALQGP
jgi:peptidoglycan/LPS O-acetylase OafA/YrhL